MPKKDKEELKQLREQIQEKLEELGNEAMEIPEDPILEDFDFVDSQYELVKDLVKHLHQIVGTTIAENISRHMFKTISATPVMGNQEMGIENDSEEEKDAGPTFNNSSVSPTAFPKYYSFISLLVEDKEEFDRQLKTRTVHSIDEEYKDLRNSVTKILGDRDYGLEQQKDDITMEQILQHYKAMVDNLQRKYTKEKTKITRFKTHYPRPRSTVTFNEAEINPLLKNLYNEPVEGALNENTVLTIWGSKSQDRKFVCETSNYNFPQIKTLSITKMNKISQEFDILCFNKFMGHSITKKLSYLHLGADKYMSIGKFMPGLKPLLHLARDQIYLGKFVLNGKYLKEIIESGHKVKHLVLYDCKIDTMLGYSLDNYLDYRIQTLDLFKTAVKKNRSRLYFDAIEVLISDFAKTQLRDTLKEVYVKLKSFHPKEVQSLFDNVNMKVKVVGGDQWPFTVEQQDNYHVPVDPELPESPNSHSSH